MEKSEQIKILSWRFAGVVIPWLTIFTMFLMAHEKYIRMQQVVEAFPRFSEAVEGLKTTVSIFGVKIESLGKRLDDMTIAINRLEARGMWRGERNE